LGVEIGAVEGARFVLHGDVVAILRRNRLMERIARLAGMERMLRSAVVLHEEDRHAGRARTPGKIGDARQNAVHVVRRIGGILPHALLHIDDHERLGHVSNSVTGVHFSLRRSTRVWVSSASKSLGSIGASMAGGGSSVLTLTVIQRRPSSSSSAPI